MIGKNVIQIYILNISIQPFMGKIRKTKSISEWNFFLYKNFALAISVTIMHTFVGKYQLPY